MRARGPTRMPRSGTRRSCDTSTSWTNAALADHHRPGSQRDAIKDTSVCVIDESGRVVCEVKVASEPEAIGAVLADKAFSFKRIGLEAGPLSQCLFGELTEVADDLCRDTAHESGAVGTGQQK